MKVVGFSFVRNALKFDYPIVEAIESVLPLCDQFVVAVGESNDETLNLIRSINNSKIRIIETVWDESLKLGGRVLASETNKAFEAIDSDADWAFYIQGDEVLHEKYIPVVKKEMQDNLHNSKIDGLLFKYLHFYCSYDYVANSRKWYRREIRIIRNNKNITSYKDAQGFRKKDGNKLNVKLIDAYIYHYGWVRNLETQKEKMKSFESLWHNGASLESKRKNIDDFDYKGIDSLILFNESHPAVMKERVARFNQTFDVDITKKNLSFKNRILEFFERLTGWRIGEYRNYKLIS